MTYTKGLDVSYYEPKVDWGKVFAQGYLFMYAKATQGVGFVDSKFSTHWAGAKKAGLLRGAYHYLVVGQDPIKQADLFLNALGNDLGELPPVLDLEGKYNETATNKQFLAFAKAWLDRVEQVTGRKSALYSGYYILRDRVSMPNVGGAPNWAKNYPLWIAQYLNHPATESDTPLQPKGWQDWKFWQYSEHGIIDGVTGDDNIPTGVDLNYFRGSADDLYAFAGLQKPQPGSGSSTPVITTPTSTTPTTSTPATTTPVSTTPVVKPTAPVTYVVKAGDNLSTIAIRFHTTVDAIVHLNNISNPNLIYNGQVLVIPQ
jgi:lysozyme